MKIPIVIIAALAGGASVACAAPVLTTYATQASFLGATSGGTLDFENFNGYTDNTTYASLAVAGTYSTVTFDATGGYSNDLLIAGVTYGQPSNALFSNYYVEDLLASFTPGVTAVGSAVAAYFTTDTFDITVLDGVGNFHYYSIVVGSDYSDFFGFQVAGGDVVSIKWAGQANSAEGIDDFYWGFSQVVPLPSGAGLAGLGLLGLGVRRRRVSL